MVQNQGETVSNFASYVPSQTLLRNVGSLRRKPARLGIVAGFPLIPFESARRSARRSQRGHGAVWIFSYLSWKIDYHEAWRPDVAPICPDSPLRHENSAHRLIFLASSETDLRHYSCEW